ncbi:MAG: ABC transporter ATP-binding protein, partial [Bacteroidota bacterium]
MNALFEISSLSCAYEPKKQVLFIDQLQIKKGELVFLLGASGSGKSTLLETLGLMNNTIDSGTIKFMPSGNGGPIDYASLWQENDDQHLSEIRKGYFGFIFQNTNLMEHFSAYENVCLPMLIKDQQAQLTVGLETAQPIMEKVGLTQKEVDVQKLVYQLSGGQRQRLAFVRALHAGFRVLLCDEPTGNLDEENSNELLNVLRANLDEEDSSIIVSHDIDLALNHADRIVVITKDPLRGYGEVLPENIFEQRQWADLKGDERYRFREMIRNLYQEDVTSSSTVEVEVVTPADSSGTDLGYKQIFAQKEIKAFAGERKLNFIKLLLILFLT